MPSRRSYEDNVIAPTAAAISTEVSGSIDDLSRIMVFLGGERERWTGSYLACHVKPGCGQFQLAALSRQSTGT
ncbi:MAG: hypothetical protein IIB25_06755 [Chloroflexi bacterium]|nr:hypothetical protein [Chloroflexota bacterium]